MARLARKYETAVEFLPRPVIDAREDVKIGIIGYGSTDPSIEEARHLLKQEGVETNYLRLRALPFNEEVAEFVAVHDRVYVVEMNHLGQMNQIFRIEFPVHSERLVSLPHNNGLPIAARWIVDRILEKEQK